MTTTHMTPAEATQFGLMTREVEQLKSQFEETIHEFQSGADDKLAALEAMEWCAAEIVKRSKRMIEAELDRLDSVIDMESGGMM